MAEKACRNCRAINVGDACALCQSTDLTKKWEGVIYIENTDGSEVAASIGAKAPGKYALKIK